MEAVVAQCKVLSHYIRGGNGENRVEPRSVLLFEAGLQELLTATLVALVALCSVRLTRRSVYPVQQRQNYPKKLL
jgi:hypothetical protein